MSDAFEGMIGHTTQAEYLRTLLQEKSHVHAYCFSGASGLGKGTMARRFASAILGIRWEDFEKHPDVLLVDLPIDEKTGEQKSQLPVESIRDLRGHLQLSSLLNGMRVAIIEHADRMTITAQNALLKTLEEPRKGTLIILIAESAERLLPTIRSRSVEIRFTRVPSEQIRELVPDELTDMVAGRPGVAMQLQDAEYRESVLAELASVQELLSESLAGQIREIEKITKARERSELKQTMGYWQILLRKRMLASLEGAAGDPAVLARQLQRLSESARSLDENVSPQLAFEHVILNSYE